MENKFIFLTKHSLKKTMKSKWFKIVNVIVMLVIVALVNIDGIITFFGPIEIVMMLIILTLRRIMHQLQL